MKKLFYLFAFLLFLSSCETEEIIETSNAADTESLNLKRSRGNTTVIPLQDHKDLLAWNSFIVGEVMRLDLADRNFVLNSVDPVTKTVSMTYLLSQSLFYDHYVHIATYATADMSYDRCGNPDNNLWPPADPKDPYGNKSTVIPIHVQNLLDNLIINRTEIYLPNTVYVGNTYTVGHPLVNQIDNMGSLIYFITLEYNYGLVFCQRHSEHMNVGPQNQADNDFIILSRPNLDNGNPYPYINFDVNLYLQDLGNSGGGGPYLGGS